MVSKLNRRRSVRSLLLEGRLVDKRFRRHWKNYLFQCALSILALLLILLVMDVVLRVAIVAAVASSAFIVFVTPHSAASRPRRVIGGHVVASPVGSGLAMLYLVPSFGDVAAGSNLAVDIVAVLSVGLAS